MSLHFFMITTSLVLGPPKRVADVGDVTCAFVKFRLVYPVLFHDTRALNRVFSESSVRKTRALNSRGSYRSQLLG